MSGQALRVIIIKSKVVTASSKLLSFPIEEVHPLHTEADDLILVYVELIGQNSVHITNVDVTSRDITLLVVQDEALPECVVCTTKNQRDLSVILGPPVGYDAERYKVLGPRICFHMNRCPFHHGVQIQVEDLALILRF
jgi:hypothetical protein